MAPIAVNGYLTHRWFERDVDFSSKLIPAKVTECYNASVYPLGKEALLAYTLAKGEDGGAAAVHATWGAWRAPERVRVP